MSLLKKLFSRKSKPVARVRVCVECGMPVAEHKEWCAILKGQQERERAASSSRTAPAESV
jgi:hypothetical protein